MLSYDRVYSTYRLPLSPPFRILATSNAWLSYTLPALHAWNVQIEPFTIYALPKPKTLQAFRKQRLKNRSQPPFSVIHAYRNIPISNHWQKMSTFMCPARRPRKPRHISRDMRRHATAKDDITAAKTKKEIKTFLSSNDLIQSTCHSRFRTLWKHYGNHHNHVSETMEPQSLN